MVRGFLDFARTYAVDSLSQLVSYDFRNQLYDKLQHLSFAYHDKEHTGNLMSKATADVEAVRRFVNMGLVRSLEVVLRIVAITAILVVIDWKLALISLAFPLIIVVAVSAVILLAILFGAATLGNLAGIILSLGGISIAAFWVTFSLIFWMLSKAIFAYLIGHSLIERVNPESMEGRWGLFIAMLLGVLIYEVIRAIPLLGILTAILVILMGVGAIFQVIWDSWQRRREATA